MNLNLKFYKEKEENLKSDDENIIEKYISNFYEIDYEKNIKNKDQKKIRHLTNISQNILNWYSFKENSSILEIGGNLGEITGLLSKKAKKVVTIESKLAKAKAIAKRHEKLENLEVIAGEFDDINLNEKFDYITLIGSLPYVAKANNKTSEEFLKELEELLNEDGKILLAVDNRFGIKYFVGNPENYLNKKFVGLLNYNNEEEKIETYTKQKLTKILDNCGYKCKHFYYPLPDYRMPNVVFSDNNLPKYNTIDKYVPYPLEKSDIIIDEIDLFREILKNDENMFTFFTNAYLVEASKKECDIKYQYISFNNIRKAKYRLITKITSKFVEKEIVDENASKHYEQIKENINLLNKADINMLDSIQNEQIVSTYINQENMLSNILTKKLEEGNREEFFKIIDEFYEKIKKSSENLEKTDKTIFDKKNINISKEEKDKLHFLENGFWDMTFKNCFYIDNKFYFFDQEWRSKAVPVEYILYRSFVYTISLRRFINIEELIKRYNLDKYVEIFKELDVKLQEEIRDDSIWKFYSENHYFDIDSTKQELVNMKIREEAKDKAIENMQKQIQNLENQKVSTFVKKKIKKIVRRKNNE